MLLKTPPLMLASVALWKIGMAKGYVVLLVWQCVAQNGRIPLAIKMGRLEPRASSICQTLNIKFPWVRHLDGDIVHTWSVVAMFHLVKTSSRIQHCIGTWWCINSQGNSKKSLQVIPAVRRPEHRMHDNQPQKKQSTGTENSVVLTSVLCHLSLTPVSGESPYS